MWLLIAAFRALLLTWWPHRLPVTRKAVKGRRGFLPSVLRRLDVLPRLPLRQAGKMRLFVFFHPQNNTELSETW
jgi:hypothetical protein